MNIKDFVQLYTRDSLVKTIAELTKPNEKKHLQLKGLRGSLDAIFLTSVYHLNHQNHVAILHDKEEAAYFLNDVQNLIPGHDILVFPTSYKKPYEFEETENANVLQRIEVLNKLANPSSSGEIIITYPEALSEKVIERRTLSKNTYKIKTGEELDLDFLTEFLIEYDFEKTDFVYEAGQFAIRGGIVDIFSFSHDLPFRVELFGDEIDSIRSFNPDTQLSVNNLRNINIVPDLQTKLIDEDRHSFFNFIPKNTKLWIKDYELVTDSLEAQFELAKKNFETIIKQSGKTDIVLQPDKLFENSTSFEANSENFVKIEFGNRFYLSDPETFSYHSQPQPSFNKNFNLIAETLDKNNEQGIVNIFVAESHNQLDKIRAIFEEIDPYLKTQDLNIALRGGFVDMETKIACYTDHQLFERFHRYKTKTKYTKTKALTLKEVHSLNPGDYVTHIDYGIGRFAGLEKIDVNGNEQEALRIIYKDNDLLYVSVQSLHKVSKYSGKEGVPPTISKLGSQEWENKKKATKRKLKDIAKDLIQLYAKRKSAPGFSFSTDSYMQAELETSFIYEDTPDQAVATNDVKHDMEEPHPMDRLVCGDVGFGKTEVAIRAAFKAVSDSKQVAVLVPTTILAMQHYHTFKERLNDFPVNIDYLNRFRSANDAKEILKKLESGEIDIIIGTHRLANKNVRFNKLGLLVIDEEQKFGVRVKEKLKEFKVNVDVLTLTATPIPRTLHFSLMGARDLSVISTPPPNRQPVTTEIHTFNQHVIRDAVSFEIKRGGQVFFVHNRIKDIEEIANIILKLVPDARIGVAHGQMEGHRLEKVMLRFIEGDYDVLVSTNIIESGLDIPNANTIIINQAHSFGLSDLHQMRGRVGRSNRKAFCFLLTPHTAGLTSESIKRLKALEEFSDLGDGFKVAMRDLDIRGAGNLLGAEQSGFINDLGFDAYHKILDETVQELKETEFKDLFKDELKIDLDQLVNDCNIETDFEALIPEDYVGNISERLRLYNTLDNIEKGEELDDFIQSLEDRFGKMPEQVETLIKIVKLRWSAEKLGFERVLMKNEQFKGYFVSSDNHEFYNSDIFGKVLSFVQQHPRYCKLKETKSRLLLIIDEVTNVEIAANTLKKILESN